MGLLQLCSNLFWIICMHLENKRAATFCECKVQVNDEIGFFVDFDSMHFVKSQNKQFKFNCKKTQTEDDKDNKKHM